jgi:SAM-dependent methyltransferase
LHLLNLRGCFWAMKFSHAHILSCVLSELSRKERALIPGRRLRILDTGCGHGGLIADALLALGDRLEGRDVEIYGFEVQEHGAGRERYWDDLNEVLCSRFPDTDWTDKVRVASASEEWPFEDEFFDLVMSNQVLEHVEDLEGFFAQQHRVLKPGGIAIHHFPTVESLVDPHSGVPFVHWSRSDVCRERVLRFFSSRGIGKYETYRARRGHSIDQFVNEFVDYLRRFTSFRSMDMVESLSRKEGFAVSARYNWALAKRWIGEAEDVWSYSGGREDAWFARVLSRFASVTLVCEK